jgi:hypothetical protein
MTRQATPFMSPAAKMPRLWTFITRRWFKMDESLSWVWWRALSHSASREGAAWRDALFRFDRRPLHEQRVRDVAEEMLFDRPHAGLRSWRRPLPSASVRRKSTSRSKEQGVQGLRPLSLQHLFKYILNLNKTAYLYNYLIFLLFLARY